MWRIGFAFWACWQIVKWAAVGAAVLVVLYLWGGFNGAFILAVLAVGLGLWGLKATLGSLYQREETDRRWSR
ncbi:hypothetical protein GCM10022267_50070 [Lentzea roselyniae]|uniref:Uncharacterized protein n=1 Tax=Lentzea roselyniae TaxID=531940 RepID=A0ABP7BFT2_9PSEU